MGTSGIVRRGALGFMAGSALSFLLMVILTTGASGSDAFDFVFVLCDAIKNPSAWLGAFLGGVVVGGACVTSAL